MNRERLLERLSIARLFLIQVAALIAIVYTAVEESGSEDER